MTKDEHVFPKYLAGWEVNFENTEVTRRFLQTQAVSYEGFEFFKRVHLALELRKTAQGTIACFKHADRDVEKVADNVELPDIQWEEHDVFFLKKCEHGRHVIGGEKPPGLQLPTHPNLTTPFQYIGCIDGTDSYFDWLKTPKLHLLFPVYECNFGVYLDWSDPNRPIILNPETFDPAWWNDEMEGIETVVFDPTSYCTTTEIDIESYENKETDDVLLCGAPLWYQSPEIPVCPKTNETMKYVCTVNSDREIRITSRQTGSLPFSRDYLCFGDCGWLFVFYHPDSKIMHVNAQFL